MAGFVPDEGEHLIAQIVHLDGHVDRAATMEMGLFTDATPDADTITEATITEPTGGGYARKTLTDASWNVTAGVADYAQQTFTCTGTDYNTDVYGYFIASVGTTQRLLYVEIDGSGPYDINVNDTYKITPNITVTG